MQVTSGMLVPLGDFLFWLFSLVGHEPHYEFRVNKNPPTVGEQTICFFFKAVTDELSLCCRMSYFFMPS